MPEEYETEVPKVVENIKKTAKKILDREGVKEDYTNGLLGYISANASSDRYKRKIENLAKQRLHTVSIMKLDEQTGKANSVAYANNVIALANDFRNSYAMTKTIEKGREAVAELKRRSEKAKAQ